MSAMGKMLPTGQGSAMAALPPILNLNTPAGRSAADELVLRAVGRLGRPTLVSLARELRPHLSTAAVKEALWRLEESGRLAAGVVREGSGGALAKILARAVRDQKLTLVEVALASRLSRSGVRTTIKGRSLGTDETLRRLAVALGLELPVLLAARAEDALAGPLRIQADDRPQVERLEPRPAERGR